MLPGAVSITATLFSSSTETSVPKRPKLVMISAPGTILSCSLAISSLRFFELRNMKKIRRARTASMTMVNGSMGWGLSRMSAVVP